MTTKRRTYQKLRQQATTMKQSAARQMSLHATPDESILRRHEDPIPLGIDSPSSGPPKSPQAVTADIPLSGLNETHTYESADQHERDSESQPQRMSVGASSNTHTETRIADSPQPTTHSCELVTLSDAAQPEELTMQRLPRRAATRQRQLL